VRNTSSNPRCAYDITNACPRQHHLRQTAHALHLTTLTYHRSSDALNQIWSSEWHITGLRLYRQTIATDDGQLRSDDGTKSVDVRIHHVLPLVELLVRTILQGGSEAEAARYDDWLSDYMVSRGPANPTATRLRRTLRLASCPRDPGFESSSRHPARGSWLRGCVAPASAGRCCSWHTSISSSIR